MSFDLHVDATNWRTGEQACYTYHDFNYTSNVLPMIRLATGDPEIWTNGYQADIRRHPADLYGHIFPTWSRNRDEYLKLNPANGWGDLKNVEDNLKLWLGRIDKFRHDDLGTVTFLS